MTFFKEGDNPQPGIPAADCYAYTFGKRLASGKVTPCTVDGERAEFVFNDTVAATENGFGVGLLSPKHSGGIGVPVLAGGAVDAGEEVSVKMVNFTIDGAVVSLPVAIAAADGDPGDFIVGKATMGSSATEADTDATAPSLAIELYDLAIQAENDLT